jgi:hypothetical protein
LLEIYHIALLEWFRDRLRWRDKPVPIIFATPDRAFSEMRALLDASQGTEGTAEVRDQNIPLPFLSLGEAGMEEYDGSRDNAAQIRGMYVNQELTRGVNVDWPTPVNLPYNLEFWCESRNQLRQFVRQIRRLFKLEVTYLDIDFTSPHWEFEGNPVPPEVLLLGKRQVALNKSTWTDASNLDPGEGKREIRASLALVLNAWMARGFTEVPLVREIRAEIVSLADGILFTTFVATPPEIVENGV